MERKFQIALKSLCENAHYREPLTLRKSCSAFLDLCERILSGLTKTISFWRILMQGPPDTPYEKGVFELYCQFVPEYPVKPPIVRFVTHVSYQNTNQKNYCIAS
uniref:UBC core domain-containing protein n=1 Tax=Amphilophus citrinellus TaxID=61819 RepID=A0A3Q0SK11_AMPCI